VSSSNGFGDRRDTSTEGPGAVPDLGPTKCAE
jgi:hypothetical protein